MTRTLFVSDVHLRPAAPAQQKPFLDFLATQDCDALYLLGDIFDYWLGPRHLRGADYREVLAALRDRARRSRLAFLPGNRDYFVDGSFESATGVKLLGDSARLELEGRRVLLAHGDFIYNRNPKYSAYRRMMRFSTLRAFYLAVPEMVSRGLAWGLQEVSRATTPAVRWTREDLVEHARPHFRRGVDVLVCGHIHAPQHVRTDYRGRARDIFILGDWDGGTRDYLVFDGEFRLRRWDR